MTNNLSEFYILDKDYLLAETTTLNFDIYYSKAVKNDIVPVLLVAENSLVSNLKDKLAQRDYGTLYIKMSSLGLFEKYIENSLLAVISDPLIPIEKKTKYVHNCAINVLQHTFKDPRSGENIKRVENVTKNIVKLVLNEFTAIPHMLSLSAHNYYTFTHCLQVTTFGLGLRLFIDKGTFGDVYSLALGCMLHDIGKMRISNAILDKPGELDASEFDIMKKHPEYGVALISHFLSDEASLDIIMHHHEKFDGTGYPEGLKENAISDNAKIAAIADVYDALTTNRAYAKADRPFDALVKMKKEMVGHFEHQKYEQFIKFLGAA